MNIYDSDSLIRFTDDKWKEKVMFPSRVIRLLEDTEKWDPKAVFCFDNKPLMLFFENPKNKETLHKTVWNFNETPIIIVIEDSVVSIYNGFAIDENTNLLKQLGGSGELNDFNYFELVTGKAFEKYNKEFDYLHRVDYKLLKNIENAQEKLLTTYKCSRKTANALLGKIIFVRYLIDRKVKISFDGESKEWTNEEFCNLLLDKDRVYDFFQHLQSKDKGFNGDLFPISKVSFGAIPNDAFKLIKRLLEGDDIKTGQKSLFQLYDFSVLPIEFISNVYERFIGKENQAKAGAYYTPTFLVDYIVSQTVTKKLNEKDNTASCKVLDPACGSGIFLVETLRKIIEKHISLNNGISKDKQEFKETIKKLTKENIFGIDKDESAVQVAIFSIYLTLLDYQKPPEIETFKFPELLNTNFFVADFFDTDADYNQKLKECDFDFILGNPPWAGGKKGLDSVGKNYIDRRLKIEKKLDKDYEVGINNNEIAEGFLLRVSDFSFHNTCVAFIIKSSILYNMGYREQSPFRPYWLQEFYVDQVFELAPVRHEVFDRSSDPAVAPAAIVFYKYAFAENTDKNIIEHITLKPSRFFSMFKIFTINRNDYKRIEQSKLKQYDWLWKTLVYGSYLDFNFLNRIKSGFPTIKETISNEDKFQEGTGIQYSSNPTYNSEHLIGKPFIDVYGVEQFFINPDRVSDFDMPRVHRIRAGKSQIFKAPMILLRKGLDMDTLCVRSAVSKQDLLFKDSLTSISTLNKDDIQCLYNIQAVFSTDILSYYAINSFAYIGIEREQTQNYDKYSLPYLELDVQTEIERIEKIKIELYNNRSKIAIIDNIETERLNKEINKKISSINNKVLEKLDVTESEKTLIDYALQVSKVMIVGEENKKAHLFNAISKKNSILTDYAQLFLNRFQANLSNDKRKFIVEIWHTEPIIGMFFKIIQIDKYKDDIVWIDNKQNDASGILRFLKKISSSEITDKLFVQKDIRGFEKDCFYIVKPNEKRLWHKAIGYLDVNEFADAILRAGRDM
ncbi:MAG TPA: N-6 DNA methylase [Bacteroidales bacterium]|nr:N-6 DNA methylase [Bacteroidales bacterium]